jgi:hydroxymethylpyrimidine pyrophosphatase-like HAD family hydrolase
MSQQFLNNESKTIAIDFDGTIVEHDYPRIGKEMLFAFATIKELQKKGHKLILFTYRTGTLLNEAVEFCRKNGVEFYAVNKNYPEEQITDETPRKLNVDIFIDDRNVGGFLGWSATWQILHPEGGEFNHAVKNPEAHNNYKQEKTFFQKLFGKKD